MTIKDLGTNMDGQWRNDLNNNFKELSGMQGSVNDAVNKAKTAEQIANEAIEDATKANELSNSVQKQLDTLVVEGDSSVEAAQARIDEKGVQHNTLKERIDSIPQNVPNLVKKMAIKVGEMEAIAHRGCANIAPENTMIAYSIATTYGFDSWECDVQISSDGIPVVIHDATVNRTTNGTGNVKDMTLTELKALDASKTRPYFDKVTIPTFEEWLIAAKGKSKFIYPEIKGYRSQADIALMVDLIVKNDWENTTVMQSFIASDLTKVRELNSKIVIGYLVGTEAKFLEMLDLAANDGNAVMLSDYNLLLSKPYLVQLSRSKGIDVAVWTVDSSYLIQKLKSIGITRFMSNFVRGVL